MTFASIDFIAFFAVVLAGTALIERRFPARAREGFLLAASYFFYAYWDWRFCFLLLFVTGASYFSARAKDSPAARAAGIALPLAALGLFKYFGFFLAPLSALLGRDVGALRLILPVGISFYTFQAVSYVVDVHRGRIPAETDFVRLALYIAFFPQLVAGPIVRAGDFLPQLGADRRVTSANLKTGVQIFAFGLFKKLVLADHLSVLVDDVYGSPAAFHWATLLLAAVSCSLQIYLDFSGYSDMAVGCAKCLGYDLPRNFNLPYLARSVSEFWRRWHISLSAWLRDYVYIPLGGNRRGTPRRCVNLLLTMLLGGLWHGAGWTFVFWGGLNGLALVLDKLRPRRKRGRIAQAGGVVLTFAFVTLAWVFFRAESFSTAWAVIRGIFTLQPGIRQPFSWSFLAIGLLAVCTTVAAVRGRAGALAETDGFYPLVNLDTVAGLTVFFTFLGLILCLACTGENPFVYFQF